MKCSKSFEKRPRSSIRQWVARKYCSFECRKLTTNERSARETLQSYHHLKKGKICPTCRKKNISGGVYHKACNKKRAKYGDQNKKKNWVLEKLYGITFEHYSEILKKQDNKCAICCGTSGKRSLSVDHDHKTGKIRGLLCDNCNHGIGKFQDNIELLEEVIKYLKRN